LKKADEYKYIVRFPPDRKVEKLVIGKASVFDLNRPGVVGSLSVWNGEIEPVGTLADVWVQKAFLLSGSTGKRFGKSLQALAGWWR
jgi:hypothetical protein